MPEQHDTVAAPGRALLSLDEVTQKVGCSKRSVYNFMETRGFPRPVTVGRPRWDPGDVETWLRAQLQPDPRGGSSTEAPDAPSDQPEPTA